MLVRRFATKGRRFSTNIYEYLRVFTYSFNRACTKNFSIAYPSSLKKAGREEDKISIACRGEKNLRRAAFSWNWSVSLAANRR